MSSVLPAPAPPPVESGLARRAGPILAAGLLGLAALLLQPVPAALLQRAPELATLPPLALRALLLLNPAILVIAAAFAGAALAHRVGLRSVLAGTASPHGLGNVLAKAAALGVGLGAGLGALDAAIAPFLGTAWQQVQAQAAAGATAVVVGALYGGLAEEVMLRWGLMALLAWALAALPGLRRTGLGIGLAIALSALVFGLAHLPALAIHAELSTGVIARTLLLNGMAGVVYGWLFWRRHLEAAMAAHAATHVGLAAWRGIAP